MSPNNNQKQVDINATWAAWEASGPAAALRAARRTIAEAIAKPHCWRYWRKQFPWPGGWQHFDTKFWEPEPANEKMVREIHAYTKALLHDLPAEVETDLRCLGDWPQTQAIERMLRWRLGWPPAPTRIVLFKDEDDERREGTLIYSARSICDRIDRVTAKIVPVNASTEAITEVLREQTHQLRQLMDAFERGGPIPDFGHNVHWPDGGAS